MTPSENNECDGRSSRRAVLIGGATAGSALALFPMMSPPALAETENRPAVHGDDFVTTKDGTEIFYKDWGNGPPIIFSHGWPLNADVWDDQMGGPLPQSL